MKFTFIKNLLWATAVAACLISMPTRMAAEEITLFDAVNTNEFVPLYGQWADQAQKCEFVIPAESLNGLNGKNITSLKFYSDTPSHNWAAEFTIFLKEVDHPSVTGFSGTDGAITVYNGTGFQIDTNKEMLISFTVPYTYRGGNLLVGIYKEKSSNYKKMSFYGKNQEIVTTVSGKSSSGLNSVDATSRYFLPKTTLTYEDASVVDGASLVITDYENGSEFDFGTVPSGTEKTFTLTNHGTSELSIEDISLTGKFAFVSGEDIKSLQPSQIAHLTISTPSEDATGELRIKSNNADGDYVIRLKSALYVPKPQISLDVAYLDFGKATTDLSKEVKVTNSGDAPLSLTVTSEDERFEVYPTALEVKAGESESFTVNYRYNSQDVGVHESVITLTSNAGDPIELKAKVEVPDPDIWSEDFEGAVLPKGWSTTGWTVKKLGIYEGGNETYMAYAGKSNSEATLTTPRLYAKAGQTLSFVVGSYTDKDDKLTVQYSHDLTDWKDMPGAPFESGGEKTFTADEEGFYYIKFNGRYGAVDNFYGFKLALKEHDLSIASVNLPAEGHQYVAYNATIKVTEMMGNDEEISAFLYFGDEIMAEDHLTINAGESKNIIMSFVPARGYAKIPVKVVITYAGGEKLVSDTETVNITEALVWDENSENELTPGTYPAIVLKYKAQAGWNTISTPFQLTKEYLSKIFGDSYTVFELDNYKDGVINLKESNYYASGYPYVVYVNEPSAEEPETYSESEAEGVILENVKVDRTEPQYDSSNGVKVMSNFSLKSVGDDDPIYIIDSEQKSLIKPDSVKAFNAYISLDPSITEVPELKFFDRNGVETGIKEVIESKDIRGLIFNLNGQRMHHPLHPGIYIIDGKTVLIK